ncbi:MAG: hypothetical protein RJB66_36 [Pseudomonadota bacterium]|jgi:thymidylate synthase (FAD)
MLVKLVAITPKAEEIMAYCARVSNPANQDNPNFEKLLTYCIKNDHWSVFEQANMVLEINTSRAIAAQVLRHRSFNFQEFSQRYASVEQDGFVSYDARRQDIKNRQNSIADLPEDIQEWFKEAQSKVWDVSYAKYQEALDKGIAKECARFLLPLNTSSRLYMNGTIRSWIHYITVRTGNGTQAEHMEIAEACKSIFCTELPTISRALNWV